MLTDPIGPRSPDEILAVVYQRTDQARRRRRRQLAAGVAVVALGLAGLVSLQAGEEDASRVRVVDRNEAEEASDDSAAAATTTTVASALPAARGVGAGRSTATTAAASTQTGTAPPHSGGDDGPAPTTPPVPTTTTTVSLPDRPDVEVLAQASDAEGDSTPSNWYWDVVQGSMHLDVESDVVAFATQYRTPTESGSRETRVLSTSFDMHEDTVTVSVTETGNTLGTVTLDGVGCNECTATFDDAEGRLLMLVPRQTMDERLQTKYGAGATIEDEISGLLITTARPETAEVGELRADESGDEQ